MAFTKQSLTARVAAGAGAIALATLVALGGALPASAAPNIDADERGQITVHKHEQPATTGQPASGLPTDLGALPVLDGVEFTAELVPGTDLTTTAGWTLANQLRTDPAGTTTARTLIDAQGLPAAVPVQTALGEAVFSDLDLGVYLVTEHRDLGGNSIVQAAEPFLVTVPMPHATGPDAWLYDVHVYPKNSTTGLSMVLDDSAAVRLGDTIGWTITAEVPEVATGGQLSSFIVEDTLAPGLTLVGATVVGTGVTIDATSYVVGGTAPQLLVTFTPAGLDALEAGDAGEVAVTLEATVDAIGDGTIENTARLWVGDAAMSPADALSATALSSDWGTISILKHQSGDETAVLEGAEFQVFATSADAAARIDPLELIVGGVPTSTFVTGADGIAFIPGLKADATFYVVETLAPVGFQLDQQVRAFTVAAGDVTRASVDVRHENTRIPAYALPVTGGSGQAAFMIGGAGLILGAMGFALTRRRKAQAGA